MLLMYMVESTSSHVTTSACHHACGCEWKAPAERECLEQSAVHGSLAVQHASLNLMNLLLQLTQLGEYLLWLLDNLQDLRAQLS